MSRPVIDRCTECERPIPVGDALWTLNLQREVQEPPPVTVLWAQALKHFCDVCQAKQSFEQTPTADCCSACKQTINSGQTKWVISWGKEVFVNEHCIEGGSTLDVAVYCERCAKSVEFGELAACCPLYEQPTKSTDAKTTIVATEHGPLISFHSQDPRGFSFHELDVLIAAAKHAQRMLIDRANRELESPAQEDASLEARFFEQQSKLPVDS